ncbi:MAG: response regulator [Deltaproteobacteria bacterium]|nr:response regulator [Deltaproteobacteria bacterium]
MESTKILLVDDEVEFVETLAERIKIRGFDVRYTLNGEEALATMNHSVPDVMILDLKMPGLDGMEVLRRVKKHHPDVQVLILTGHGSKQDEKEARHIGAFDYLQKPVDIGTLIKNIERACQNRMDSASQ